MLAYIMLFCHAELLLYVIYHVEMFSYIVLYPVVMLLKCFNSFAECMLKFDQLHS
jgi:hypothetical protein